MKVQAFVKRILTSTQRKRRKSAVLKDVLATPQENRDFINIHRIDTRNAGDFYCGPHHYFEELKGKELDIFDFKDSSKSVTENWIEKISKNSLIIGGGGLLNRGSFQKQIHLFEALAQKHKKTVLWGVGHNSKEIKDFGKISDYNISSGNFGLVGVRDYGFNQNWVPCVSCLHPFFDQTHTTIQETGIIFHKKTLKNKSLTARFKNYPTTSNTTNLEDLIKFIGSSENIITDSYHAMYWSILLGKKVVVVPNSSKFFDFKYKPVISTFQDCLNDTKKATSYSGVLEECREININFAGKVFDYLGM